MNDELKLSLFLAVILLGIGLTLYIIVAEKTNEIKQNWQEQAKISEDERKQIELMSCEELKNSLQYNTIKKSDNLQRAIAKYLGMGCNQ